MTDQGDGIDDELSSAARVAITVATQMADRLARAREEAARTAQSRSEHEVKQVQQRFSAERDAAVAKVSVVERPEFWERSTPTEQASMHETAQQWKDLDPRAHAASKTIGRELQERYGIDVNDPQADPDAVRTALVARERADAEAAQAAATAEKSGSGEAAVETALAGAALDEAARLDARAASERNDGQTISAEPDADGDTSRTDRAAELELQAREYDAAAENGGTAERNPDELRELAEDARAQAQLHREPAELGAAQRAPQQSAQVSAEANAASDQGYANAERSTGEVHYDTAERRTAMAAELGRQGVPQHMVDVRMRAEVSQGRPASEAPTQGQQVHVPQTKRGRGANRATERTQQDR
ncbi:hypothetical protein C5E16_11005 [Clavibacter michiganensis]|uniref:Colicin import membrane protein n=1 Tax=Clavibacter michiganensis TaxID=28447 RepID=A0A2S5VSD3_9MICO|nr:hypothetical protein [Clavibacter michiganensis]PPF66643.1 hypothetical protein C5E16_11005 [Clavibacter michiganensis]